MPKTRFDNPKRDALLELVLGRKSSLGFSEERLAEEMHFSRNTLRARLNGGSDNWTISELKRFCRVLDIPIEEMRQALRM